MRTSDVIKIVFSGTLRGGSFAFIRVCAPIISAVWFTLGDPGGLRAGAGDAAAGYAPTRDVMPGAVTLSARGTPAARG